ncbi:MAG: hypothetical protein GY714_26800 [Desulfobacterales bacterium]|nr:hypothetical protein [Desulfobacterales bacterium]
MSLVINTNIVSERAINQLSRTGEAISKSVGKASSGKRIVTSGDDAAGLAIADRMESQHRGYSQAIRNASDGISIVQTADGALSEYVNIINTIRTKAIQAANAVNSSQDRMSIQDEINQLLQESERISNDTMFNESKLLTGEFSNKKLHVGAEGNENIVLSIPSVAPCDIGHTESMNLKIGDGCSSIKVDYENFLPQAKEAFEYAKSIWETILGSSVEIKINAEMKNMDSGSILGGSINKTPVILGKTAFVPALSNAITGSDNNGSEEEISMVFNTDPSVDWYFGTKGKPGENQYDFATVVMHEIGHGLGISSQWWDSFTSVYDSFLLHGESGKTIEEMDEIIERYFAVQSNDITWKGEKGIEADGGLKPVIYAPYNYRFGSSISHLDEYIYNKESGNALMTPATEQGNAIHTPGPVVLGMLQDMGWTGTTNKEGLKGVNVLNYREAMNTIKSCDKAILEIDQTRSKMGALQNRLTSTVSNLSNAHINISSAKSVISDLDYASETSNLARLHVLNEAGLAAVAGANKTPGVILSLLA